MATQMADTVTLRAADANDETGFGIYNIPRSIAVRLDVVSGILDDSCVGQEGDAVCIPLPSVEAGILLPIIEYITAEGDERAAELSNAERNPETDHPWIISDEYTQPRTLSLIIEACLYLGLESLRIHASREFGVRYIRGHSPDEIRETFGIKNDLSPKDVERIAVDNGWRFPTYDENWTYGVDMEQ